MTFAIVWNTFTAIALVACTIAAWRLYMVGRIIAKQQRAHAETACIHHAGGETP